MMSDIFSSFDQNIYSFSQNMWFFMFFISIYFNLSLWMKPSFISMIMLKNMNFINNQVSLTLMKFMKSFNLLMMSLFLFLMSINFNGLIPYMFSFSSHLIFSLTLSIPLWLSLILSSFMKSKSHTIAHLLPSGAPSWLNPFLIIIETTSIMVRPMTLAFRLAANMSAGHIILILISSFLSLNFFSIDINFFFFFLFQMMYFIFEIMISMIQAFIFFLLLSLYSNDHFN